MRAGSLAYGDPGSNDCPANASRITNATQCQAAAYAAGRQWYGSTESLPTAPRGCYWFAYDGAVHLNTDAAGGGNAASQLLCALAPTGACVCVLSACVRVHV